MMMDRHDVEKNTVKHRFNAVFSLSLLNLYDDTIDQRHLDTKPSDCNRQALCFPFFHTTIKHIDIGKT